MESLYNPNGCKNRSALESLKIEDEEEFKKDLVPNKITLKPILQTPPLFKNATFAHSGRKINVINLVTDDIKEELQVENEESPTLV